MPKFKQQITEQIGDGGTKDVEIIVPLKYQSNFWRILEIALIKFEVSPQLKLSKNCILVAGTAANQNRWYKTLSSCLNFINSR